MRARTFFPFGPFTVNEVFAHLPTDLHTWIVNDARGSRTAALGASGCGVTSGPYTMFGREDGARQSRQEISKNLTRECEAYGGHP